MADEIATGQNGPAAGSKSPPDNAAVDKAPDAGTAQLGMIGPDLATKDAEIEALRKQLSDAIGERDQVGEQLSTERAAHEQTRKDFDAAKSHIAALENEASVRPVDQGRKLRPTNNRRPDPGKDGEEEAYRRALDDAIAGEVEIVFSDGKREIRGLDPIKVSGPVWQRMPAGLLLTKPIELAGPPAGVSPYEIKGFALFDDEGDQIAWSELPEPIRVMPNGRTQIRQSIIF